MRLALLLLTAALWAQDLHEVEIASSLDGEVGKAMWWHPGKSEPVPLLVALHSWSADYKQKDSHEYAKRCALRGWAMIFPDFRGPNVRPIAAGSDAAVQDVVDAVAWAKKQTRIDARRVFLVGGSGGGYMSLLMAARHPKVWTAVSSWVPIADLAAWHGESKERKQRYAPNLEAVFGGPPDAVRLAEYRRRSPLTTLARARGRAIDINAGIHDGHTGSVPVSHSLRAFNVLAPGKAIAEADIAHITSSEKLPEGWPRATPDATYPKPVLFRRESGKARVTLFEGGHEILFDPMFAWLDRFARSK